MRKFRLFIPTFPILVVALVAGSFFSKTLYAQTAEEKAAANPVANKIALDYQSVFLFDYGEEEKTGYSGVFQPVLPYMVGPINFISRPMLPVIALPDVTLTEEGTIPGLPFPPIGQPGEHIKKSGLGDLSYQLFLSPAKPGSIIWGAGPVLTFPTATDPLLGNEKFMAGPAFVALAQPGKFTIGTLVANSWSYAGKSDRRDTNQFLLQYFVNYNLGGGWSVATQPIMTANWKSDNKRWMVPIGGGINKLFPGKLPIQVRVHAYWHAARPDSAPKWQLLVGITPVILMK